MLTTIPPPHQGKADLMESVPSLTSGIKLDEIMIVLVKHDGGSKMAGGCYGFSELGWIALIKGTMNFSFY